MYNQTKCAPDMPVNEKEYIARQVENLDGGPVNGFSPNYNQPPQPGYPRPPRPRPETNLSWLV